MYYSGILFPLNRKTVYLYFLLLIFFIRGYHANAQRLVLPGDHPDPSVVKIGSTYWASSTTSNWAPSFPVLHSKDLLHWKLDGYVFDSLPSWADYYFWAPEISYDKGKVYIYYAAHKKNGNLCVGVATADHPEGPFKDLGPLVCQEDGSIDAFAMRDEKGKLYLIWKEDANSVNRPTPIWAMEMKEDRTGLVGEKKELFRNSEKWEGNLVEGVSMIKHGGYFYAFYAASGCCGIACTYSVGVARSKSLMGPWEKYEKNPIMTNNRTWICPGHGTPVERNGRYYLLHHAYDKQTIPFTGRQGILSEFRFTKDKWIQFINEPDTNTSTRAGDIKDNFTGKKLSKSWQWSVFERVHYQLKNGMLELYAAPASGAYIGQEITSGDYEVSTRLDVKNSTAAGGVALLGDEKNILSAIYEKNLVRIIQVREGKETVLFEKPLKINSDIYLRMSAVKANEISFFYSADGKNYIPVNDKSLDATFIPPWDRAVRVGLISKGTKKEKAVFRSFELFNK
jgi:xylan 1,4-beta-xylosidase